MIKSDFSAIAVEKRRNMLERGQREWKRKHVCYICDAVVCDTPRHVSAKHSKEDLVKEALSEPKGSKERRNVWKVIVNKGIFKHNLKGKDIGGEILVNKRTSTCRKSEEYKSCPHCYGYFLKTHLWKHAKSCQACVFLGQGKMLYNHPYQQWVLLWSMQLVQQNLPIRYSKPS